MASRLMDNVDFKSMFTFETVIDIQIKARIKHCFICDPRGKMEVCNYGVFCNNAECRSKRCHQIGHGACLCCGKMACKFTNCNKVTNPEHISNYCHHRFEDRKRWWMKWIAAVLTTDKTRYKIKNMLTEDIEAVQAFAKSEVKKRDQKEKKKFKKEIKKPVKVYVQDEEGNFILVDSKIIEQQEEEERRLKKLEAERIKEQEEIEKKKETYEEDYPEL